MSPNTTGDSYRIVFFLRTKIISLSITFRTILRAKKTPIIPFCACSVFFPRRYWTLGELWNYSHMKSIYIIVNNWTSIAKTYIIKTQYSFFEMEMLKKYYPLSFVSQLDLEKNKVSLFPGYQAKKSP